ncbi:hypothetical protein Leryth_000642 [Lithospermum erythrorhizon]|nr:hypothetical protein Leryth_000642 [Lithospermum erythrorhizon]
MAIVDAAVLGQCLCKWGVERLDSALHEYQSIRLPVVSQQVLHSRRMGLIKQGLVLPDGSSFNPSTALPKDCEDLQMQRRDLTLVRSTFLKAVAADFKQEQTLCLRALELAEAKMDFTPLQQFPGTGPPFWT